MTIDTRIDEPGAGEWIMERAQGYFRPGTDHSFTSHDGDQVLGGIALVGYLGASFTAHMAGDDPRWFSRELAWLTFHYAFVQLECRKLLIPVRSDNYKSLSFCLRAGTRIEAVFEDVFPDAHMFVLSMTKDTCPWLDYTPRHWAVGELETAG